MTCVYSQIIKSKKKYATKWFFNLNMLKTYSVLFVKLNIWVYFWLINIKNGYDPYPDCLPSVVTLTDMGVGGGLRKGKQYLK